MVALAYPVLAAVLVRHARPQDAGDLIRFLGIAVVTFVLGAGAASTFVGGPLWLAAVLQIPTVVVLVVSLVLVDGHARRLARRPAPSLKLEPDAQRWIEVPRQFPTSVGEDSRDWTRRVAVQCRDAAPGVRFTERAWARRAREAARIAGHTMGAGPALWAFRGGGVSPTLVVLDVQSRPWHVRLRVTEAELLGGVHDAPFRYRAVGVARQSTDDEHVLVATVVTPLDLDADEAAELRLRELLDAAEVR